ncbi:hypothetical protein TruAng_004710 [Truncatella angustata]|nr:hypothetical protein TruAng_004710 [Truncatella angustata]
MNRIFATSSKSTADYPPISSIPRTSADRLAQASPDYHGPKTSSTTLYLAYGSNLSARTFLGARGIRPISSINVSAPALDLTFDLPGLPYREPCFANTAPRKIPAIPLPGHPPTKPPINLPPSHTETFPSSDEKRRSGGDGVPSISFPALPIRRPTWTKGLYGVVYEVTASDYSKIIATEGGGSSYADVAALCIALPPAIHVPEQPVVPELRPFLARTLFAPRLPEEPPTEHWWQRFLLPVRRAEADYAQPSLRYLGLLREGAAEHFLPLEYQEYLQRLEHYRVTTRRQELGKFLFMLFWSPFFLLFWLLAKVFSSKDGGKFPRWLAIVVAVLFNTIWLSYDVVFKSRFGDGERTVEEDDDDTISKRRSWWRGNHAGMSEKNRLLNDW